MKSWNKAVIGLLVASAMALGTGVAASADTPTADSAARPSAQEAQVDTSKAAQANKGLKSVDSPVDGSQSKVVAKGDAKKDAATPSARSQMPQPQAQSASAPQAQQQSRPVVGPQGSSVVSAPCQGTTVEAGDWGDVHWCVVNTPEGYVTHLGPGKFSLYADESDDPSYIIRETPWGAADASDPLKQMVRLVFDDPANTKIVRNAMYMFSYLPKLEAIDGITDVALSSERYEAYEECGGSTDDGSHCPVSLDSMFSGDVSLKNIDLHKWSVPARVDMKAMFENDSSLQDVNLDWGDNIKVDSTEKMFGIMNESDHAAADPDSACAVDSWLCEPAITLTPNNTSLTIKGITNWDKVGSSYWGGSSAGSMFRNNTRLRGTLDLSGWHDDHSVDPGEDYYYRPNPSLSQHMFDTTGLTRIILPTCIRIQLNPFAGRHDLTNMFANNPNLTSIDNLNTVRLFARSSPEDTSIGPPYFTMDGLFANDPKLGSVDLSGFGDTSDCDAEGATCGTGKLTSAKEMFKGDTSLKEVKGLNTWDISNLRWTTSMFEDASVTGLDLSSWNTTNSILNTGTCDASGWLGGSGDGTGMFPKTLNHIKLGSKTKLDASFFSTEPKTTDGFTGIWMKSDGTWKSDQTQASQNQQLVDLTKATGFAGGEYGWQATGDLAFNANAPAHTSSSGTVPTQHVVGMITDDGVTTTLPANAYTLSSDYLSYEFGSWNSKADGSGRDSNPGDTIYVKMGGTTTVYAKWLLKSADYKVYYHASTDGLPGSPEIVKTDQGDCHGQSGVPQLCDVFTVDTGDMLHQDRIVKDGNGVYSLKGNYIFKGWNTKADGTGTAYAPGDTIHLTPGVTDLYTRWEAAAKYTVNYDANKPSDAHTVSGSVGSDSFTVHQSENPSANLNKYPYTLKANGYTLDQGMSTAKGTWKFDGWSTKKDAAADEVSAAGVPIAIKPGTTTVYAQWTWVPTSVTPPVPKNPNKPVKPGKPGKPVNPNKPNKSNKPNKPVKPSKSNHGNHKPIPTPTTIPGQPTWPNAPAGNNGNGNGNANNSGNGSNNGNSSNSGNANGGAATSQPAALAPQASVIYRYIPYRVTVGVAPNVTAPVPTPVPGGLQRDTTTGAPKKARPKCMPDDVARRLQAKKKHAKKVTWLEADETAYGTSAAWSDEDYVGLPKCSFATPSTEAVKTTERNGFNWWWLLLLLLLVIIVSTYIYEKNKQDGNNNAQHYSGANGDGVAV